MKQNLEWLVYTTIAGSLALSLFQEGARQNELLAQIPITGGQLLKSISQSQAKIQILDVRPTATDDGYDESHIPGAIPFPGCDLQAAPEAARKQILEYAPTVIVSQDGSAEIFAKCRSQFKVVRNLAGGMQAWLDDSRPEDSGEYTAPRAAGGGGCL
jgi:rhodanese-related sulfurtransferase